MMHPAALRFAAGLALVIGTGGCGLTDHGPCTLIGCEGGLWIQLGEATAGPVAARATLPDGTVLETECAGEHACGSGLFFADVTAPSVVLEVEMDGVIRTLDVDLTYVESRPNGPDCPPACPIATVRLKEVA